MDITNGKHAAQVETCFCFQVHMHLIRNHVIYAEWVLQNVTRVKRLLPKSKTMHFRKLYLVREITSSVIVFGGTTPLLSPVKDIEYRKLWCAGRQKRTIMRLYQNNMPIDHTTASSTLGILLRNVECLRKKLNVVGYEAKGFENDKSHKGAVGITKPQISSKASNQCSSTTFNQYLED